MKAQRDTFRIWRAIVLLLRVECFDPAWVNVSVNYADYYLYIDCIIIQPTFIMMYIDIVYIYIVIIQLLYTGRYRNTSSLLILRASHILNIILGMHNLCGYLIVKHTKIFIY